MGAGHVSNEIMWTDYRELLTCVRYLRRSLPPRLRKMSSTAICRHATLSVLWCETKEATEDKCSYVKQLQRHMGSLTALGKYEPQ